jgi:nucleotide-binding universal stress UspA family protein
LVFIVAPLLYFIPCRFPGHAIHSIGCDLIFAIIILETIALDLPAGMPGSMNIASHASAKRKEVVMFKEILVAVDGSDHGIKAAAMAGDLARLTGGKLWVVVAYDPLPTYIGDSNLQEFINTRMVYSEEIYGLALNAIGKIPGEIHKEIIEGPAAEAVLSIAGVREVDLIVMGTRGLGRLASIVIGSQSQKVTAHAHCPVLLVR